MYEPIFITPHRQRHVTPCPLGKRILMYLGIKGDKMIVELIGGLLTLIVYAMIAMVSSRKDATDAISDIKNILKDKD